MKVINIKDAEKYQMKAIMREFSELFVETKEEIAAREELARPRIDTRPKKDTQ